MRTLLDVQAVCARVGVVDQIVYYAVSKGHLRPAKTSRRPYMFDPAEVDRWAARRANDTRPSTRGARVPIQSVTTRLLPSMTDLIPTENN